MLRPKRMARGVLEREPTRVSLCGVAGLPPGRLPLGVGSRGLQAPPLCPLLALLPLLPRRTPLPPPPPPLAASADPLLRGSKLRFHMLGWGAVANHSWLKHCAGVKRASWSGFSICVSKSWHARDIPDHQRGSNEYFALRILAKVNSSVAAAKGGYPPSTINATTPQLQTSAAQP